MGGKSSTGNLIMGKDDFEVGDLSRVCVTVRCEVGRAEVQGRQLTVVDTPGWYCTHPLEKTPELDKLEIRRSVYLCPAGPHVILLIVPVVTRFNGAIRTGVEEHMSLLGKDIWKHTIVLFTWGDWLGDTTIEERIEAEGEHLQWLLEQSEHRYHVFDCTKHTDSTQVLKLFEKIEDLVIENNGRHFEPETDRNPSAEYDLKMQTAKTQILKVSRQRNILQELFNGTCVTLFCPVMHYTNLYSMKLNKNEKCSHPQVVSNLYTFLYTIWRYLEKYWQFSVLGHHLLHLLVGIKIVLLNTK